MIWAAAGVVVAVVGYCVGRRHGRRAALALLPGPDPLAGAMDRQGALRRLVGDDAFVTCRRCAREYDAVECWMQCPRCGEDAEVGAICAVLYGRELHG